MMLNIQRKNIMPKSKAYVKRICVVWFNDKGQHHREDGPAFEYTDGTTLWYLNGRSYAEEDYNAKIKTLR